MTRIPELIPLFAMLCLLVAAPRSIMAAEPPLSSGDRIIRFSGYDWRVKVSPDAPVGPGPNLFSADNVQVEAGKLYLRIAIVGGRWQAAEVVLTRSLGYGTYSWVLDTAPADIDPNAVAGLFTWSDDPADSHREIDIELSRWGSPANRNAQCVVQPYDQPDRIVRFAVPSGKPILYSFTWTPRAVRCDARELQDRGSTQEHSFTFAHRFTMAVPRAGDEAARMNLWLVGGKPPADGRPVTVIISEFAFTPTPLE